MNQSAKVNHPEISRTFGIADVLELKKYVCHSDRTGRNSGQSAKQLIRGVVRFSQPDIWPYTECRPRSPLIRAPDLRRFALYKMSYGFASVKRALFFWRPLIVGELRSTSFELRVRISNRCERKLRLRW